MGQQRGSGVICGQSIRRDKILRARELRKKPTEAEEYLWSYLRLKQINGLHFRRQQVIDGYIADFYCDAARLVVEVDGGIHDRPEQKRYDERRRRVFERRGLREIRFRNEEVMKNAPALTKVLRDLTRGVSR